jgi:cytochrome c biogenesis protein CcmG/thiol:disulfide interchange protein DsbE
MQSGALPSGSQVTSVRRRVPRGGRPAAIIVGAAGLALAGVLALAMSRGIGQPKLGVVDAGFTSAADFSLPTLDGRSVRLADYADRPVFLYFWASWCAPCRNEAPVIQQLWAQYRDAGYVFIGVNMLDSEDAARAFVDESGVTFPVLRDVAGDVYLEYGVYGLPEAFFLRPGLQVEEKYIGAITTDVLRQKLAAIGPVAAARP